MAPVTQAFTQANFLALIRSAIGTPYLYGGINPFGGGADCSGLVYWAGKQLGVTLPRTTSAEWAGLPHFTDLNSMPIGALVEFAVPSDGAVPPNHVGINIGSGFMIDDPHTGTVVQQQVIPDEPGVIWPIGYCLLPFVTAPLAAPGAPPPTHHRPRRDTRNGCIRS
jgi:cell wall-associated NlpC family hydrolase